MNLEEYEKEEYVDADRPPFSVQQHPWLVICHGEDLKKQAFFSVSENRYYMRRIPQLKEKIISAYADEWLVLESIYSNDCFLWNLISNDKIQLPPLPAECDIIKCLLSAPPTDPECHIIFLIKETRETTQEEEVYSHTFYFCKPGYNEEFHKQDAQPIIEIENGEIWTFFKSKLYVLTFQTRVLICLDPDNDSGRITVTQMANEGPDVSRYLDMEAFQNYIIQSFDSDSDDYILLYVHLFLNGKNYGMPYHFLVFWFDFAKKRWIEAKSIGEIAIFLIPSTKTGTTCSTRGTNLNRESIYFTHGRYLYMYNLITHSLSVSVLVAF